MEVKIFGPDARQNFASLAEPVGKILEDAEVEGRQHPRPTGKSRPRSSGPTAWPWPASAWRSRTSRINSTRPCTARSPRRCPSRTASPTSASAIRTGSASIASGSSSFPSPCRHPQAGTRPREARPRCCTRRRRPVSSCSGQVATIERKRSPNELWRENQQPMINVTGRRREGKDHRRDQRASCRPSFPSWTCRAATAGSWPASSGPSRSRSPAW